MSNQQVIADLITQMHDRIDAAHASTRTINIHVLKDIRKVQKATAVVNDEMDDYRRHLTAEC